ncbi:MAG: DUF2231 domain-containing protein [Dietzia sp.]
MNTIAGLPAHPLLVHGAVVLLPLAALVVVAYAVWPAARARIGVVAPALALIAAVAAKLAEDAGESLERLVEKLPDADQAAMNAHAELGEQTVLAAAALVLVALALYLVHGAPAARLRDRIRLLEAPWVGIVGAVVAVITAVVVVYLTIDAGHTGASMVWSDLTS